MVCHSIHLLGVMDRLWFQQVILFPLSEPKIPFPTSPDKSTLEPDQELPISMISSSSSSSSSSSGSSQNNSFSLEATEEEEEEISSSSSLPPTSPTKDHKGIHNNETELKYKRKRPKRLSVLESKARCRSTSPALHKLLSRKLVIKENDAISRTLRKTASCRSLSLHEQLEYEELKGFMDLGFTFNKEQLCPRMMSVLPGLQRLDDYNDEVPQDNIAASSQQATKENGELDHQEFMEDKKKYVITRPYLSEAWLIKSPNSPLLNLRMPPVSDPSDMKKHLKSWARTIIEECEKRMTDEVVEELAELVVNVFPPSPAQPGTEDENVEENLDNVLPPPSTQPGTEDENMEENPDNGLPPPSTQPGTENENIEENPDE